MNPKIQKLAGEIEKAKARIAEQQARVREMERQKTELENAELVAAMRGMRATPEEFEAFLASKRGQRAAAPVSAPARETPAAPFAPGYQPIQEGTEHDEE